MYRAIAGIGSVVFLLAACRGARTEATGGMASPAYAIVRGEAIIRSASGATLGTLEVHSTTSGSVRVSGTLTGLPTGMHGIHVHATGRCDAPDFLSAGGHLNPGGASHGLENPMGPHAGDAPNIQADAQRVARVDFTLPRPALPSIESVFDADGAAVVVHAAADDQKTDPSGNSGARIACGVVARR